MGRACSIYDKNRRMMENFLFPLLLILYPLIGIRQGIDVSDTTYSLANFQYFTSMEGTWIVATFLANVAGRCLMALPFGGTLMGMYFYTALIQSGLAVAVYCALKRKMPAFLVFLGEGIVLVPVGDLIQLSDLSVDDGRNITVICRNPAGKQGTVAWRWDF